MLLAILATVSVISAGITVMLLERFVIKSKPKGDWIPVCFTDGRLMVKVYPTKDMPDKIKHYLATYGLPRKVLQKWVCKKCGRELWIAPQVEDMTDRLYATRKA